MSLGTHNELKVNAPEHGLHLDDGHSFPDARMRAGKECERRVRTGALGREV